VNFSVTLQSNPKLRTAIEGIDEQAWTPVRYPGAVYDEPTGCWISDAEVAETTYTAFESSRHKVTARLVVRRVKERDPAPNGQTSCSRSGATTPSSPTPPNPPSRPT
jgi:hypothetical protein